MKKISMFLATPILFSGCGNPFHPLETSSPLKSESDPSEVSSAMQNTSTSCDFSTSAVMNKFPDIAWPAGSLYREEKFLELRTETAKSGYSSFTSSKNIGMTKTERQREICDQLENEFVGFGNAFYRDQYYLEQYEVASLEEATKNLKTDEFASIKPTKAFFTVKYPDPRGDTKEPIKIKNIPIEVSCKESIQVRTSEQNRNGFNFKHNGKCTFEAIDHEYKLNSGEKIKISLVGSLGTDSEKLVLKIKEVSWRDTKK